MSLAAGTHLGSYEIISPLGVGGMGEVYRARNTKIGREVALKILPALFAADPDRLALVGLAGIVPSRASGAIDAFVTIDRIFNTNRMSLFSRLGSWSSQPRPIVCRICCPWYLKCSRHSTGFGRVPSRSLVASEAVVTT